jgi:hypothetical protein
MPIHPRQDRLLTIYFKRTSFQGYNRFESILKIPCEIELGIFLKLEKTRWLREKDSGTYTYICQRDTELVLNYTNIKRCEVGGKNYKGDTISSLNRALIVWKGTTLK